MIIIAIIASTVEAKPNDKAIASLVVTVAGVNHTMASRRLVLPLTHVLAGVQEEYFVVPKHLEHFGKDRSFGGIGYQRGCLRSLYKNDRDRIGPQRRL